MSFSRRFTMNTVSKLANDVNKLPPGKTTRCLSQGNLGPAPSLAIVAWLEIFDSCLLAPLQDNGETAGCPDRQVDPIYEFMTLLHR